MIKKLVAVAFTMALSIPGFALAQSSVTISGFFKMSVDNQRIGNFTRAGNNSETRVADDASRIVINVVEDLGGGLRAIAQLDWRLNLDQGADTIGGNNHIGLRSKSLGRIFVGRQDLHYFNRESNLADLAGSLKADSISLLAYAGGGGTSIAAAARTPNVIHYTSPNWGGFTVIAAYSTNPNHGAAIPGTGAAGNVNESDIGSSFRKGSAWYLNPNFESNNWQIGWSHWDQKDDGGAGAAALAGLANGDQRSDRFYGSFKFARFKIGFALDKSRISSAAGVTSGTDLSNRSAWSLPISYVFGQSQIHAHFTKANDDRAIPGDNGARMIVLSYQYVLSRRTSVGLTYATIRNNAAASYNFYTNASLGSGSSIAIAGEDPRMVASTIRHAF